jgi:hypothetical protein
MPSHRILPNLTSQKTSKIVDHGEGTHFNNDPPRKIGGIRWTFPPIFAHNSPGSPLKLQEVTTSRRYWKLQTLQVFRRFQCEDIGRMGHVAFVKKECEEKSPKDHWICPINKTQTNPIQWIRCQCPLPAVSVFTSLYGLSIDLQPMNIRRRFLHWELLRLCFWTDLTAVCFDGPQRCSCSFSPGLWTTNTGSSNSQNKHILYVQYLYVHSTQLGAGCLSCLFPRYKTRQVFWSGVIQVSSAYQNFTSWHLLDIYLTSTSTTSCLRYSKRATSFSKRSKDGMGGPKSTSEIPLTAGRQQED